MKTFVIKLTNGFADKAEKMYKEFCNHYYDMDLDLSAVPTFENYLSQIIGFYILDEQNK